MVILAKLCVRSDLSSFLEIFDYFNAARSAAFVFRVFLNCFIESDFQNLISFEFAIFGLEREAADHGFLNTPSNLIHSLYWYERANVRMNEAV